MTTVTRGHGILEGFLSRQRCALANALIPTEARRGILLDIGCGSYPYFLCHTDFAVRHGIDQTITHELADTFRDTGIALHPTADIASLPFEDNHFDVITMLAVFEHIDRAPLLQLVREIHRVLKPDGRYILTTPAAWSDGLLRLMARTGLVSKEEIDEHKDAYTHAKIRAILHEAGFQDSTIKTGYFECFLNIWCYCQKG